MQGSKAREHRRQLFIESPLTQNILRVLVVVSIIKGLASSRVLPEHSAWG